MQRYFHNIMSMVLEFNYHIIIQTISQETVAMALYFASTEDFGNNALFLCLPGYQGISKLDKKKKKPVRHLRVIGHDTQSESQ